MCNLISRAHFAGNALLDKHCFFREETLSDDLKLNPGDKNEEARGFMLPT